MKAATAAEMREIDRIAISDYGIPGTVLMENAGVAVVRHLESIMEVLSERKFCIFAGKGNNGGDGYVIARHLVNQGAKVKVFLLGEKASVSGDARINLDIIDKMNIDIIEIASERDWDKVRVAATFADCLVDALVGTGFRGEVVGDMARVIDSINAAGKLVVAVDIPSGVEADTGRICGKAVRAAQTVTFCLPKPGLFLYPGAEFAGELMVADIGIPTAVVTRQQIKQNILMAGAIRTILPQRSPDAHKGINGRLAVVAGSRGLSGAAAMTAEAALRAGAGLITLATPASIQNVVAVKLTEVMTTALSETATGGMSQDAVAEIAALAAKNDVLAIGPGIGRHEATVAAVRAAITTVECPLVIDADALYALAGYTDLLTECTALPVLTPHPGEMGLLTGLSAQEVNSDRVTIARQAAGEWGSIVILKGAHTIVAFPDGEVYINTTGNVGMATGGTGDALTGIIAAMIAQGMSSHDAALAGVYIHGLAGDIAAQAGMVGMAATDLIKAVPAALYGIKNC
ncbi:Bifunctional NAD(P)H-hydrate repair enzyme Nnr [Sporomusa ovata DSM 2662]|uniref:Bifunctional NAD(P)H-hydrate repair enzyme n=1 Tax=Sporomusa ovata TaxID=2378 RepID=A0A0U1KYY4_9FIRM|nr:NAD(P)H-hydrate dehydratase [Sporomusa ovata]EQB28644.1 bifunctional NAD(P)H-hydrate repair enzyme Nnr [Sporomusa ovata DSM 2662]CQR72153.1 NAD(P)HX epimerase / NAD(P)HX dehydratase [Sporomusa ovata]